MVLSIPYRMGILVIAALVALLPAAAMAHKDHDKQTRSAVASAPAEVPRAKTPGAMHEMIEEHIEQVEQQQPKTLSERMVSWIGRTHPFAVHFPIALFPVAFVALALARRRGEIVELIRALIIVAGATGVIAAILGWFTGGFLLADMDAIQLWHRWMGTGVGVVGGGLAMWALLRRSSVSSRGMLAALGAITLLLLVQGWLGAALVHGIDHMNF